MAVWPEQDAKAKFSEFLDTCLTDGPQIVSRRGKEEAIFVPLEQWKQMTNSARPTIKNVLLGPGPRFELELPPRGRRQRRQPISFD